MDQVMISILSKGYKGNTLNYSYKCRDNDILLEDLANCLSKISAATNGGILVFFASYIALQKFVRYIQYHKINFHGKLIQYETSDTKSYQYILSEHRRYCEKGTGSIILGVCRGRLSEGLDFTDSLARCVVIVGLPFPQANDPRVKRKKQYLNNRLG